MKNLRQTFLLLTLTVLLYSCQSGEQQTETEWIDPNTIEQGPIVRESLTSEQMDKIDYLYDTFKEVDPTPKEKWIEDFKRDQNPDREIEIWMMMANAFNTFCKEKELGPEVKNEVYQIVLIRSAAPEEEVLTHIELDYLTKEDTREIMQAYSLEAKPIRVIQE